MGAKILTVAGLVAVLVGPAAMAKGPLAEPEDGPDPRGLTVEGSGVGRVKPPARQTEQTIRRSVAAALPVAQRDALRDARRRARGLARSAELTLGPVAAVTDRLSDAESFAAPARYCGRRGCRVPAFAGASVRVTFATLETSAITPSAPVITASASATAPTRPERRTDASIRAALRRAWLVADPVALRSARRDAGRVARVAGLGLGSLFALAEEPRPGFYVDLATGILGPGSFCRPAREARVRRCYLPPATSVLRVTYTAAG